MPKPIEGHMINGKFMDLGGRVYDIVPGEAVILGDVTGATGTPNNGNGTMDKSKPQSPQPQAGQTPVTPSKETTPQPQAKEETPQSPPETPPTPPVPAEAQAQTPPNSAIIYPGCISFEILKAVQTSSFAQVTIRAHCKELFADSVVHYDFETIKQICDSDIWVSQPGDFLKFKQTALKTAHAEAVKTAQEILCEQFNQKENQDT